MSFLDPADDPFGSLADAPLKTGIGTARTPAPNDLAVLGRTFEQQGLAPWADGLVDTTRTTPRRKPSPASFDGASRAFQIDRGLDPDGIALPGGPTDRTRQTLPLRTAPKTDTRAPFTRVREGVGPDQPNRPDDVRTVRRNLKRTGVLPAFAQNAAAHQAAGAFTPAVEAGLRAWQKAKKTLRPDAIVRPGGPTEEAMVQQVGRAAAALRDRLEEVTADLTARAQAGDPNLKGVTNGQTAKTLAGEIVGREAEAVQLYRLDAVRPFLASTRSGRSAEDDGPGPILLANRGGFMPSAIARGPVRAPEKGDGGRKASSQNNSADSVKRMAPAAGTGDLSTTGNGGSRGSSRPGIRISIDQAGFPVRLKNRLNLIQDPDLRNRVASMVRGGELSPPKKASITEIVHRGDPQTMAVAEWKRFLLGSGIQPPEFDKIPWHPQGESLIYATRITPNLTITLRQPTKDQDWTIEVVIHHLGKNRRLKIRYR